MAVAEQIEPKQIVSFRPSSQIASAEVPRSVAVAAGPIETIPVAVQIRTHAGYQIAVEASARLPPFVPACKCAMNQ